MQNTVIYPLFKKIFALCERNSILTAEIRHNSVINLKYGPLGVLLKRNLYEEWLSNVIHNTDVPMFSVEEQKESGACPASVDASSKQNMLMSEIKTQYNATLPLVGERLPFGFALLGHCFSHQTSKEQLTNFSGTPDLLWKLQKWTSLSVVFFGALNKSTNWFHYWQQQRYSWWRKLCSVPSQIFLSDIVETTSGDHQVSMTMKSSASSGTWTVETVTASEKVDVDHLCYKLDTLLLKNKSTKPCMIMCQMDLDFAVVSYLCDAFEEKSSMGKQKSVLRLHQKLAPYKVIIAVNCEDGGDAQKLRDVGTRLMKELKKNGITILPNPYQHSQLPVALQFDKFDEMGIPYAVVLSEKSLATGIVGLRNRDTTIEEEVHITELNSKLLMYLQLNSHIKS